ncbi:hypothetical protein TNIN_409471 [Trichonephila inaurata madagascariensis]|uniref:Uncharacterized protein n=1 Tax=Trichonephila inaurata madagascariensis TaxID=2747483 RepID=A0A8X6Y2Y2_9ARAC|nr:hypothetical protein TNIN_409471 [Trichonephila inaurata madagascariensis]
MEKERTRNVGTALPPNLSCHSDDLRISDYPQDDLYSDNCLDIADDRPPFHTKVGGKPFNSLFVRPDEIRLSTVEFEVFQKSREKEREKSVRSLVNKRLFRAVFTVGRQMVEATEREVIGRFLGHIKRNCERRAGPNGFSG